MLQLIRKAIEYTFITTPEAEIAYLSREIERNAKEKDRCFAEIALRNIEINECLQRISDITQPSSNPRELHGEVA